MTINWKLTILAGVLGTLALDLTGLLLTGEWWDIPQLLGSKLARGWRAVSPRTTSSGVSWPLSMRPLPRRCGVLGSCVR